MTCRKRLSSFILNTVVLGPARGSPCDERRFYLSPEEDSALNLVPYTPSPGMLVPPSPTHVSLLAVHWLPQHDPEFLLPRTVASPNLINLELDVLSLSQMYEALSLASLTLGQHIQVFRLLPVQWLPDFALGELRVAVVREWLCKMSSSLTTISIHASFTGVYQGGRVDFPNLTQFDSAAELLPLLGACPNLWSIQIRANEDDMNSPVLYQGYWPSVRSLSISKWIGNADELTDLMRSTQNATSFTLECMSFVTTVRLEIS
ncbi:hypothetical protein AAF712_011021 [Marasmius tenuissimus]|uniref:Uncharacterized protein n=1 Tax=Marasmius tenuissimus TaxID=585030 RepID=A0ABR2ZMD4_9AGAR